MSLKISNTDDLLPRNQENLVSPNLTRNCPTTQTTNIREMQIYYLLWIFMFVFSSLLQTVLFISCTIEKAVSR